MQAAEDREQAKLLRKSDQPLEADRRAADAVQAERAAREASAKAQAIEDAVYDLKAVNPRAKKVVDERTPAQLLQAIVLKGREVDEALAQLQALVGQA